MNRRTLLRAIAFLPCAGLLKKNRTENRWITADEIFERQLNPYFLSDANGLEIRRRVVGFNPAIGAVESIVYRDGEPSVVFVNDMPEIERRYEMFAAPLSGRKYSPQELELYRTEGYWDK